MATSPGFTSSQSSISSSGNSSPRALPSHNLTIYNSCNPRNTAYLNAQSMPSTPATGVSTSNKTFSAFSQKTTPFIPLLKIQQMSSFKSANSTTAMISNEGKNISYNTLVNKPEHPFRQQLINFFETNYKNAISNKNRQLSKQLDTCGEKQNFSCISELLIEAIIRCGIKVVACDFDLTMTRKHSGGSINPQIDRSGILTSLSQEFNQFATDAQRKGLHLVVVTFSDGDLVAAEPCEIAGKELVHAVMKHCGASFTVESVYGYFPANWQSPEKFQTIGLLEPMDDNKSFHLQKVIEDFDVKQHEILLVDDDFTNCKAAVCEGFLSINVFGGHGFEFSKIKAV